MKKFKIIFLAKNNKQNIQINNIIKHLSFKSLEIEIFYIKDSSIKRNFIFFDFLLKFIFYIEKKFLHKEETIKNKNNFNITKKNISINTLTNLLVKYNKIHYADLIIDLSKHNLSNEIITKCKYGLWQIEYGIKDIFFLGFWECLFNYKITVTYLFEKKYKNKKIVTSYLDAYFLNNKVNSWIRNKEFISIKSSNLITKNLNKIKYGLKMKSIKKPNKKILPQIKFFNLLNYILIKYFLHTFKILLNKFSNSNEKFWKIYLLNSSLTNFLSNYNIFDNVYKIIPDSNFEWADPFICEEKKVNYIFFENNDLLLNKGKISCGIIKDNKVIGVKDILNLNYHLSYPFIWKSKKDIFLIPESSQNKSIQIWKSTSFPYKWKLFKTIFKNEYCCDTTIIKDINNNNWLFTNKSNDQTNDPNNELYIYKMIGNFDKFIPHKLNPVVTDCRTARNAGSLNLKNMMLRPSQINNSLGYGLGLNINRITSLSLDDFKEITIKKIYPYKKTNASGLHHICNTQSKIVVDIREKFNS